jgi:predicted nucleic acid-binding protein
VNLDILIADTSGLLVALNQNDPLFEEARRSLESASYTVISPMVFAELDHIVRKATKEAAGGMHPKKLRELIGARTRQVADWVIGQLAIGRMGIPAVTEDMARTARAVMGRYAAQALDMTDAINVTLAQEYQTDAILTLDQRDFRAITPLTAHKAFRILPADV